ncbi:hypothetical protein [Methanobacterium sp. MBAC-LM]|uniref:hypothetical protein n=1 Tax=Methanobacterium sp. MBAC-LM TaxID=3412034 RepID=UPI003C77B3CE
MIINENHVVSALDLSRANKGFKDISLYGELNNIVLLGKEIDLLETIRRQDNPNKDFFKMPKRIVVLYASAIGIEPVVLEQISLKRLEAYRLIEKDGNEIEVKYQDSKKIFEYGISQIKNFDKKDQLLLDLIAKGMIKPISQDYYETVASHFPNDLHNSLEDYLTKTKILSPIQAKDTFYYSSPKIYKHEPSFRKLLEYNEDKNVSDALEFICNNPGIPLDSISPDELNSQVLKGLTVAGAFDSITLNIDGVPRNYLIPSNLNSDRYDKDNLDQVKKTLANFRFSERYAKFTLHNLTRFFESLLDRGFAGDASPIGTDYRNLELAGIIRVQKTSGDRHRLWMLKKDVIEDTLNVLKGSVPLITSNPNINLVEMNDSVLTRMMMSQNPGREVKITTDAIRKIERNLL